MMRYRRVIAEGQVYPPWYYGCGYYDMSTLRAHYYLIPLNYAVRLQRWLSWRWDTQRQRAGFWMPWNHIAGALSDEYQRGKREGYQDGYREGLADGREDVLDHLEAGVDIIYPRRDTTDLDSQ